MTPVWLRLRAPFAAFRWLQAGSYRATSPVIPPSAAWGLVLNLAGVETRAKADTPATRIDPAAPPLKLAVAALGQSSTETLFQQLHSYPVGTSGKALAAGTHGAKYWIAPVRRELLVGFDCVLGVRSADPGFAERLRRGLAGEHGRYGLPFAGDNNLLFDRIELLDAPPEARWYAPVGEGNGPVAGSCRLTIGIDRGDSSRTTTGLFAPTSPTAHAPTDAWTWVPRPP